MARLVVATRNPHKLEEIRAVLHDLPWEVVDLEIYPDCPEVEEDGDTLEANAEKKARVVCAATGELTLADDTGLEVVALGGAPGVRSARYAGEDCTYADNNAKLLRELAGVPEPERTAHFRCVMALAEPPAVGHGLEATTGSHPADPGPALTHPGRLELFEGRIEGRILEAPRGSHGFGYDPLFYVPAEGCTLAEMPPERKNRVSHRAHALDAVRHALARRVTR